MADVSHALSGGKHPEGHGAAAATGRLPAGTKNNNNAAYCSHHTVKTKMDDMSATNHLDRHLVVGCSINALITPGEALAPSDITSCILGDAVSQFSC